LLVLLHGLGETHDPKVGVRAYLDRYGLSSALARLGAPPIARTVPRVDYFGVGRVDQINAELVARPYQAPLLLCPFTPNPFKSGGSALIDRYARFLSGALRAEVETRCKLELPAARTMISGVSLGGYLALEVFLRDAASYCGVGSVQGAFGPARVKHYAQALAAAVRSASDTGPQRKSIALLSSSDDPYRRAHELLKVELEGRGVAAELRVSPGPHNQVWLRESGTIELLLSAQQSFVNARGGA
jgi:pimeloyl-ACP methyl ester carboxylesterase